MMMKWNMNEIRMFLDKLENYWGYPFDYEIEICTGNFVCLARACDKVLFFSDICSENYDWSYVKMRLIYTYLIYSKNHVVMRMAQCQGQSGLYHALASLGIETCRGLGIEYVNQEILFEKERELIESLDFQNQLSVGDVLLKKQKLTRYTITSTNDNVNVRNDAGDTIVLEQTDIRNYHVIKKSIT